MTLRATLLLSFTNMLLAPIVGRGLAVSGLPDLLCIYIIFAFAISPVAVIAWQEFGKQPASGEG